MLNESPGKKVTIHVGEDVQYHGEPLYLAILNYLFYHSVAGATVTKGIAGFGRDHHLHTTRILEMSENLPVKIDFVEDPNRLGAILPKLLQMVGDGIVDVQDTSIVRGLPAAEPSAPHVALEGRAKLMRIYVGEDDRWHGKPLYQAIVESLRSHDIAGATVYRGIHGYGAHRRFHREKALAMSRDLPVMLSVIDEEVKIRGYLPVLEEMVQEGLVVLSDVDVVKYTHRFHAAGEESAS